MGVRLLRKSSQECSSCVEQRRLLGPRAPWHVGDIAWGLRQHEGRESEWKIRRGSKTAASPRGHGSRATEVASSTTSIPTTATCSTRSSPSPPRRWHSRSRTMSSRRRSRATGSASRGPALPRARRPEPPELLPLPDGFRYRTVESADVAERVAIHRDVWAPSRVTESSYASVRAAWPYRASLDCVIETSDGRFAAYALLWPDDENRVGELEPSVSASSFDAAGSALLSAPTRCVGGTRRVDARRSSTAWPKALRAVRVDRLPGARNAPRVRAISRLGRRGCEIEATRPPSVYRGAQHDVVVVGGGAAGLGAALVLGRARRLVRRGRCRSSPERSRGAHAGVSVPRQDAPADLLPWDGQRLPGTASSWSRIRWRRSTRVSPSASPVAAC